MRFPDKITSFKESVLRLLPLILKELSEYDKTPKELYESLKKQTSLSEYIDALDCLFILKKVEFNPQSEVLHNVA